MKWTLDAIGISLPEFARNLSLRLDRTVIDKTGIEGTLDVNLEYARDIPSGDLGNDPASAADTIFTALQDHLGLKITSSKGLVEILVIDHIENPPRTDCFDEVKRLRTLRPTKAKKGPLR